MPVTYHTTEYDTTSGKPTYTWHENAYTGAVLRVYGDSVRIMSDVWESYTHALVWDAATKSPKTLILWGSNDPCKEIMVKTKATVDATPEVIEAYRQYLIEKSVASLRETDMERANTPSTGKTIKVVSGRKEKGVVGKVVYITKMPYRAGYQSYMMDKLCVALNDEKIVVRGKYGKTFDRYVNTVWVWARNVQVMNPEQYISNDYENVSRELANVQVESLRIVNV